MSQSYCGKCGKERERVCFHSDEDNQEPRNYYTYCGKDDCLMNGYVFTCYCRYRPGYTAPIDIYKSAIKELKGINLLIFLEYRGAMANIYNHQHYAKKFFPSTLTKLNRAVEQIAISDYAPRQKLYHKVGFLLAYMIE